jgi:Flp pilus assembly protein TadG
MNKHQRASSRRAGSGQSLVELALSLMIMLLLVAGAVDFGMAFFSYVALRDAAQEGALFGSFDPYVDSNLDGKYNSGEPVNDVEIRARVRESSRSPVDLADTTRVPDGYITIEATTGEACEGLTTVGGLPTPNSIRVTVEYDYPIITPLIGRVLGGQTIHLTAAVTDTILEPRCP